MRKQEPVYDLQKELYRRALQKIADIDNEDIPTPETSAEANLWIILAMCVDLAMRALREGDNEPRQKETTRDS